MVRYSILFRYGIFLLLLVTTGCAQISQWANTFSPPSSTGKFNFDWSITGDKRVIPLQVFDDGHRTWLQFKPGMSVPAVFARESGEETLLVYKQSGPYVILPGVWSHLVLQGGHIQGDLRRQVAVSDSRVVPEKGQSTATDAPASDDGVSVDLAPSVHDERVSTPVALPVTTSPVVSPTPAIPNIFKVSPANGTMRETLVQWARAAQWDFGPEHWAVDVDIPIVGSAQFKTPFEEAVRALVASSELGDRPLQPCFYSNRVLRVVPFAQPCDRARPMASAS